MLKKITIKDIRSYGPCYDPKKYLPEDWRGTAIDILRVSDCPATDRLWVVCREELIDAKTLRLFAVWCAREALKLLDNPDKRSVDACDVSERFANGQATRDELYAADAAARASARAAAWDAAGAAAGAAWAAAGDSAGAAAWAAARAAADAAAWAAADAAARAAWAAWVAWVAWAAADAAARAAADAAWAAADAAAWAAQIDHLIGMLSI